MDTIRSVSRLSFLIMAVAVTCLIVWPPMPDNTTSTSTQAERAVVTEDTDLQATFATERHVETIIEVTDATIDSSQAQVSALTPDMDIFYREDLIRAELYAHGLTDAEVRTMLQVAFYESTYNSQAFNDYVDATGLFQITPPTGYDFGCGDLWYWKENLRCAVVIMRAGDLWRWEVIENGTVAL